MTIFLEAKLCDRYEIVGDVRGKGLMIGVEMVENKVTKVPLRSSAMMDIWDRTKQAGVLIGPYHRSRTRIKTEEKAKAIISAVWGGGGAECIKFIATLAILPRMILSNGVNSSLSSN